MDNQTLIGIIGVGLLLFAYVMNQVGKWKSHNLSFDVTNLGAGIILVTYSIIIGSWPFIILYLVWIGISFRDIRRHVLGKDKSKNRLVVNQ